MPERLATELQGVDSPETLSAEVRDDTIRWLLARTPAETAYWEKRKSSDFEAEHERYRRARNRLFTPEFESAVTRLRGGDASGIEHVIAFIEADPLVHSGYLKQKFARYLRRIDITGSQRDRLRTAVLVGAFAKGRREDLKEYVSLAHSHTILPRCAPTPWTSATKVPASGPPEPSRRAVTSVDRIRGAARKAGT